MDNAQQQKAQRTEESTEFRPMVVEERGERLIAFPTGVTGSDFVKSQLASFEGSVGWLVREGQPREWKLRGFTQRSGQIYFTGEYVEADSLEQVLQENRPDNLARIKDIVSALLVL